MKLNDEQLIEALKAAGHERAAKAVAEDADLPDPTLTPEQQYHQTVRNVLTNPPDKGHKAVADLFGYGEKQDETEEDDE